MGRFGISGLSSADKGSTSIGPSLHQSSGSPVACPRLGAQGGTWLLGCGRQSGSVETAVMFPGCSAGRLWCVGSGLGRGCSVHRLGPRPVVLSLRLSFTMTEKPARLWVSISRTVAGLNFTGRLQRSQYIAPLAGDILAHPLSALLHVQMKAGSKPAIES